MIRMIFALVLFIVAAVLFIVAAFAPPHSGRLIPIGLAVVAVGLVVAFAVLRHVTLSS